jgi:hypothetical protein
MSTFLHNLVVFLLFCANVGQTMKAYNDLVYANFINFIEQYISFYVRSKVVIQCNALIASSIFNCFLYCSCKVLC